MNDPARASTREAVGRSLPPAPVVEIANRFRNLIGRSHSKMRPPFARVRFGVKGPRNPGKAGVPSL
jgi:hypothetical protein